MSSKILIAGSIIALASLSACGKSAKAPTPDRVAQEKAEATPNDAPAGEYKLDPSHASVTFKVSHWGLSNYTARFTKLDAALKFDPEDPAKNSVEVAIDPTSIRTHYPYNDIASPFGITENFDKNLATEDHWLDAGQFPRITFKSTSVNQTSDTTARVSGDLTLRGVTKPVVLDVTYNGGYAKHPMAPMAVIGFSATASIKRSDFGMTYLTPKIGDEVKIIIEAEFTKPAGAAPAASPSSGSR
jgi:polyisoprenoid-binding protein YceI